eukprot:TRINITY_DN13812_c1_g1_i1.p1 TRINITY_DN13812_c1_g1~~TRINITY_DN13812_c1_g1_i1.p1  ORF type:complete len:414 (+),score=169.05 TRINITY_DN13812_c1_g1_i1:93-1244(+)
MPGRAGARVRTESMIDRLSKKPLQEGFDLWDKDFILGALRLFQCKLEKCPPFEQAPCCDAVGCILLILEEADEAVEQFQTAADKYDLVSKKPLVALMKAKIAEAREGPEAALKVCNEGLADFEKGEEVASGMKQNIGRLLTYRADLHGKMGNVAAGVADCDKAVEQGAGWLKPGDAVHLAHFTKGQLLAQDEKDKEAIEAFTAAVAARPEHFQSWDAMFPLKKAQEDLQGALQCVEKALEIHGKAALVREKAFLLSEMGQDDAALKYCDEAIAKPPHEETEALTGPGEATAMMHKAKAAIYADMGKLEEASASLKEALKCDPQDQEALRMNADISTALARDYLQQHSIPQFLDQLISMVLKSKPENPVSFMVDAIEGGEIAVP